MGFKLRLVLHLGALLLTLLLLAWCLVHTQYYATMLTLSLILLAQIATLLRFLSATQRELSRFLGAIRYADFSQSFSQPQAPASFRELGKAFDAVLERFRSERSDKEEQAGYLQVFVQQLPIAVLALNQDGRIPVANHALRRLLGLGRPINHLRQIREVDAELCQFIEALQPGSGQTWKLSLPGRRLYLKFSCTLLRSRGRQQKLITIQDIQGELDASELQAWQNLIRVMTHEIMNSVTPIASLAETTEQLISESIERLPVAARGDSGPLPLLQDARDASGTIGRRGQSLLRFVDNYRSLNRLPAPQFRKFAVARLLQSACSLMQEQARRQDCALSWHCQPETLELRADPDLLEQALINLLRNALEAVAERPQPQVRLQGRLLDLGRVELSVTDNGVGIDPANLENIFIPFFTTKRGGSGIGMSIVRQIVRSNGGRVHVSSTLGEGSTVTMVF